MYTVILPRVMKHYMGSWYKNTASTLGICSQLPLCESALYKDPCKLGRRPGNNHISEIGRDLLRSLQKELQGLVDTLIQSNPDKLSPDPNSKKLARFKVTCCTAMGNEFSTTKTSFSQLLYSFKYSQEF